jgi:hypothetical protein
MLTLRSILRFAYVANKQPILKLDSTQIASHSLAAVLKYRLQWEDELDSHFCP